MRNTRMNKTCRNEPAVFFNLLPQHRQKPPCGHGVPLLIKSIRNIAVGDKMVIGNVKPIGEQVARRGEG